MKYKELTKAEIFNILDLYNENPFIEFTYDNLKYIRNKTCLGLRNIQEIIFAYIICKKYKCSDIIFDNLSFLTKTMYDNGYYNMKYIYLTYILEYNTNTSAEHPIKKFK